MRLITEVSIFTELHVIFLGAAIQFNCPFEALPVVSSEAIPFKMEDSKIS
jgi:hypothetical protein